VIKCNKMINMQCTILSNVIILISQRITFKITFIYCKPALMSDAGIRFMILF